VRRATTLAATALALCAIQFTGAASADSVNWQAVAKCESGGNWAANTGNGAYGGLQIKPATWDANGGVGLPSQASPRQQIAVAKRILASQGPGAWPTCMSRGLVGAPSAPGAPGVPGVPAFTVPPVGSLTHFLTTLIEDAEGLGG
jgi:hypothetical protein